ncbi:MAG: DUF4827 domain-containing protein [Bacteroidales bacterium]|nr:DUF4827 domain-containing protein [Bacteroidales bacterium]
MKHYPALFLLFVFAAVGLFCSCDDEETYADRREKENQQIQNFLNTGVSLTDTNSDTYSINVPGGINVISESDFAAKGYTTDASRNEYVLFNSSGVYMQILRKGPGKPLAEGESATVLVRYTEYDIASAFIRSTNVLNSYAVMPDVMTCSNSYGTIQASFLSGVMKNTYDTSTVPAGWLIPLKYINLGRQESEDEEVARVRVIVPSTQGQINASANVYACFYDISYTRGR